LGFDIYPKFYRPQGGLYNTRQEKILIEEGYIIVPFTVIVMDVFNTSAGRKRLTRNPRGSFNRSWIPEVVEEIIIALLDKGFVLTEPFDLPELLRY
jgi:hypothetical protein